MQSSQPSMLDMPEATRLETVDEIRRTHAQRKATKEAAVPTTLVPFRPVRRPPMASLCIVDDASDDGEWVRIRDGACVLGRSEGNVIIPHDGMMSSKHAEITRVLE